MPDEDGAERLNRSPVSERSVRAIPNGRSAGKVVAEDPARGFVAVFEAQLQITRLLIERIRGRTETEHFLVEPSVVARNSSRPVNGADLPIK
ncbi:hypothetical protein [Devosia geojensis]|uniref:hypothetical protein n=1 Tax=Devosia geojensis TaxID=443610 RepID=UPI00128B11B8|nr:hypothetical protein [Devosia geojensis]